MKCEENKWLNDCPSCGEPVFDDGWHLDDGPCVGGLYYCMKRECPCGCLLKKLREDDEKLERLENG